VQDKKGILFYNKYCLFKQGCLMSISFNLVNFKVEKASEYVFRVTENKSGNKTITAERKGIWTLIKAHILCPKEYRLGTILSALQDVPQKTGNAQLNIIKKRINFNKYLSRHDKNQEIQHIYEQIFPDTGSTTPRLSATAVFAQGPVTDQQIGEIAKLLENVKRAAPLSFQVADKAYVGSEHGGKGRFCLRLKADLDAGHPLGIEVSTQPVLKIKIDSKEVMSIDALPLAADACLRAIWHKTPQAMRQSVEEKLDEAAKKLRLIDVQASLRSLSLHRLRAI
jgi:hypothetical protein